MEEDKLIKIIGYNIKKYRLLYSMTIEKLSKLTNLSPNYLTNLENQNTNTKLNITSLYKIALALDVPINNFFEKTMIDNYIKKEYINNYSDILCFSNDKKFQNITNKLNENKYIKVTSKLIHDSEEINQLEQFIFNLDNYITYLKQLIHINPLELRYIINLTIYNKYNKILYSDLYYYSNTEKYIKEFQNMFMYNYNINKKKLNLKNRSFNELIKIINTHKKRTYCYFENITNNNMNFYSSIIEEIEYTNLQTHP